MEQRNKFKKNFIWNLVGTTLNSFNSMFFMIVITRINGVDDAGVFTLLFSVANLLYNIGVYSGRTFQVTDHTGKYSDTEYVVQRIITTSTMFVIGALYCVSKNYDPYRFSLTMLLTGMKCLEAASDALHGVLQKNDNLYQSGISYTVKAVLSLVSLIGIDLVTHNLLVSFIIVDAIWIAVTLFYDIPNTIPFLQKKYSWANIIALFPAGFFAFGFSFLNIYLANATKYALDGLVSSSEQAMYGIILMPATMLNLAAMYLVQPYINRLAVLYNDNRIRELKKSLITIIGLIIVFGVIAFILATFFGIPVLNAIYGVDLTEYLFGLQLIIVGATLIAIVTVLSTALTIFRNTRVQFFLYLIVAIIIYFLSPVLIVQYSTLGASYAYLINTILQVCLFTLAYLVNQKTWEKKIS